MYAMRCVAMRCDAQNSIEIARRIQAKTKAMKSSDLTRLETQKPQKPPTETSRTDPKWVWVWRLRQGVTHLSTTAKPLNKILACRLKTIYPCAASGSGSASPSFSLFLLLTLPPSLSLCCPSHIDGIYYIYVCITFALIILSSCCCCNLCICSSALTAN